MEGPSLPPHSLEHSRIKSTQLRTDLGPGCLAADRKGALFLKKPHHTGQAQSLGTRKDLEQAVSGM